MRRYNYKDLSKAEIQKLVQRNVDPANEIRAVVEEGIALVQEHGNSASFDYALKFDKVALDKLYLDKDELTAIASTITPEQKTALETASKNIYKFHQAPVKAED